MWHVGEIQRWAVRVPDYQVTAIVLLAAAAVTLVYGLLRKEPARLWLPGVAFVACGALVIWPLSTSRLNWWVRSALLGAAAVALLVQIVRDGRERQDPAGGSPTVSASGRRSLVSLIVVVGAFLFYNLSAYSGDTLLTWETSVVAQFGDAFAAGQSVLRYTLQRFLWDDGVLSAGNTSLFYGAPTYALFLTAGFSPWTLRCAAAVATLMSIGVVYVVGRRFFGPPLGAAAAAVFALNPCVLFYGRYGSSPAGTLLAVLLALMAAWLFLEGEQAALWRAAACAVALYAATLQYSPGRLVVLILLGFMLLQLAYQWRRVGWRRLAGVGVIALAAVGVWLLESSFGRQELFLRARGENFFTMLRSSAGIETLYGGPAPPGLRPETLSRRDKAHLLAKALRITGPQYLQLMRPVLTPHARGEVITSDPPPLQLYYGPVVIFILWGTAHSLRRWSFPRACLLLWIALGTVPLLLTNRVDANRIMLFTIPLSFLAALGLWEAARVMEHARVPRLLQHTFAIALALSAAYSAVNVLERERPPESPASRALVAEGANVRGPVVLGVDGMQRDLGWAYLRFLERWRRDPTQTAKLLEDNIVHGLQPAVGDPPEIYLRELQRQGAAATVLLAPADNFRKVAEVLERRGVRVMERGTPEFHFLRFEGQGKPGADGGRMTVFPTPLGQPSPAAPPPVQLRGGPQRLLTELVPTAVSYGFQPPRVDRNWNGDPIRMGGVTYEHGLGTHAWCRMTYAVPAGAVGFQAIVGLSDGIRSCATAAVTFEVRDESDKVLYDSGLVDATTPPQGVYAKLGETREITLVVTEGGNGPDCDHALWAMPAFLLKSK
jgi:NPCBM/NEW2 domain-containing protein